ncbi:acyl-CoA:lysophosphatidylglycerol acyltransferase 1-like protein [Sarcoptes scabiei]|uniref:Acyl-CoA:lysophosphatidylglycerol acyltransferase 1-like protein n=1 Tax=Sarcoptes scabiei TaxID=52283 RepID=A0A132AEE2_SARSC|nr:acyl-CoA:lysophosphatidylglycerol acyltransferase 1-like protein [Sarcoptes scabiei]
MADMIMFIYGTFRVILCLLHNLYCVPGYLILNLILLPLRCLSLQTYSKIENFLYYSLLYIVGWWSYGCGIVVNEHGDDIYELKKDPNSKIVLLANHQSTADVPLMFQAFSSRSEFSLLWIMDSAFKWTHFGVVSQVHGDYFISSKKYTNNSILNYCLKPFSLMKNLIIIFPEGGFRYKRLQSSISFSNKKNYPQLHNVTYPRINGFKELLSQDLQITHVVDLTICYDHPDTVPSIIDVIKGTKAFGVHFYYKIYSIKDNENIRSEEWLYELWQKKEALLSNHYRNIHKEQNHQVNLSNFEQIDTEKNDSSINSKMNLIFNCQSSPDRLSPTLRKRENSSPFKMQLENGRSHSNEINQKQSIGSQTIQDHSVDSSDSQKNVADNLKFRSYHFFSDLKFDPNDPDRRSVELSFCKVLVLHLGFFMVSFVFCIGVGLIVLPRQLSLQPIC